MRQQPQDREKFDTMMKVLSNVDTKEELAKAALLYILDLSFPRADIMLAVHDIEVERGWH